jgi:hypothetical protein
MMPSTNEPIALIPHIKNSRLIRFKKKFLVATKLYMRSFRIKNPNVRPFVKKGKQTK